MRIFAVAQVFDTLPQYGFGKNEIWFFLCSKLQAKNLPCSLKHLEIDIFKCNLDLCEHIYRLKSIYKSTNTRNLIYAVKLCCVIVVNYVLHATRMEMSWMVVINGRISHNTSASICITSTNCGVTKRRGSIRVSRFAIIHPCK